MIQELLCGGGLLLEERNLSTSTSSALLPDGSTSNSSTPATTPPHSATSSPTGHQNLRCPRCDSSNTKFCYYNNYNLTQPRHFCKTCRRYWTKGGALRNVPIGGGCRKTRGVGLSMVNNKSSTTGTRSNPITSSTPNSQFIASLVRPPCYTNPFLTKPNNPNPNQNSTPISHTVPYDPTAIMKNPMISSKLFGVLDPSLNQNINIPTGVCGTSLWSTSDHQYSNYSHHHMLNQQVPAAASRIHHLYQMLKSNSNGDHQNQVVAASATTTVTSRATHASSILDHTDHQGGGAAELWNNNWNLSPLYWSDMAASNADGAALP